MKLEGIDKGNSFDWGKTSRDYAKYRDIYPVEFCITTRNFWRVVNLILNSNLFVHIEQTSLKLYNYLHDNN